MDQGFANFHSAPDLQDVYEDRVLKTLADYDPDHLLEILRNGSPGLCVFIQLE
jgi:hypothetical protein